MPTTFLRLDASWDDAFGEVAGVGLQRFDAAGLEHRHVVVVIALNTSDVMVVNRPKRRCGAPTPKQLSTVLTQVGHGSKQGFAA